MESIVKPFEPQIDYNSAAELYWDGKFVDFKQLKLHHDFHPINSAGGLEDMLNYSHHWKDVVDDILEANNTDRFDSEEFLGIVLFNDDEYQLKVATRTVVTE